MFFTKHKKIIVSLAAAAVMSLGGVTALAATGPSLTPAGYVDLANMDIQADTLTVVKDFTPQIFGRQTAKTAPGLASTPVSGSIDTTNVQEGTYTVVKGVTPQIAGGHTNYTTAAK
ncbi:hypothetical protein [Candidatus Formimonas warabiya]|uniref:WxL domain-containing protein n=1 Tax=Formimonas warabiya TaxID=1761012 RepID=A0A3G1KUL7_FORW1|nr:hypothetical protein [Candidatus Formimonas warabiya]ATW26149.1 hypothetical protein DCMF_16450 [Candidatus Formimonas warabiya]